jgi:protein O-mannosyl-transferase
MSVGDEQAGAGANRADRRRWWDSAPAGRYYWLALVVALILTYQPTWDAEFIWDDDAHLTAHPSIVGPLGLKEVWTTSAANYFPLVLTTWWVVHKLFGLDPLVFHLLGVGLHIVCTLLLWAVLRRLRVPGAWLGASLWGLHPVQVESVAWVSETINTQSGAFFLLSLWFATRWLAPDSGQTRRPADYWISFGCAVAAMLSKPSTVMLPVVIGLSCWWLRGRLEWRDARWLAPYFLFALATSGWAIWEQRVQQGAVGGEWALSFAQRVIIAGKAGWFYAGKVLWPHPLSFIYPRWNIDPAQLSAWLPAVGTVVVVPGLALLAWRRGGVWRGGFFATVCFLALLFPVLGFFNVYFFRYSFVADHFQYLASMALVPMIGVAFVAAHDFAPAWMRRVLPVFAGTGLLVLATLSWRHTHVFRNDETLWRATLRTNPDSLLAHNNLGVMLVDAGKLSEAIGHYERALKVNPALADTHFNQAKALAKIPERLSEAVRHFEAALERRPHFDEARLNLANALAAIPGRRTDAIWHYEELVRRNPQNAKAHTNLSLLLGAERGRLGDAVRHGETAVELTPNVPEAHFNLANNLAQIPQRASDAIRHYQRALQLQPNYVKAHINLGLVFARSAATLPDAIRQYEAALALEPESAITHNNLAIALAQSGRDPEARRHFERALQIDPEYQDARRNLALLLGQSEPAAP